MKTSFTKIAISLAILFTAEQEIICQQYIDGKLTHLAKITSSEFDVGNFKNLIDGDTMTYARTKNISPCFVQFEFGTQAEIDSVNAYIGMRNVPHLDLDIWKLEAADTEEDILNKSGSYRLVIDSDVEQAGHWQSYRLSSTLSRKIWRFTASRTVLDSFVHIYELGLYGRIDRTKIDVFYPIGSEILANNIVVKYEGGANPEAAYDGNAGSSYEFKYLQGSICFIFNKSINFNKIKIHAGSSLNCTIEAADTYSDLNNRDNSYKILRALTVDKNTEASSTFEPVVNYKFIRLSFEALDTMLIVNEVEFLSPDPPEPLTGIQDEFILWKGWRWRNTPENTIYYHLGGIPKSERTWKSSDTNVVTVDSDGYIIAKNEGNAVILCTYKEAVHETKITVKAPVKEPEHIKNDYLETPEENCVWEMPVVIIQYIPTSDGIYKDNMYSPNVDDMNPVTVEEAKQRVFEYAQRFKLALEEGSKFRKYKNPNARSSIGVKVVDYIIVYEPLPPGLRHCTFYSSGLLFYTSDFNQIFDRFNLKDYVENKNVKQIWFWASGLDANFGSYDPAIHRPEHFRAAFESYMSTPTQFRACNGGNPEELNKYDKTYTVICGDYAYPEFAPQNFEPFTHQFEWLFQWQSWIRDGNGKLSFIDWIRSENNFFFHKFVGTIGRCGWTHTPPNTTINYGYWHDIQIDTNQVKPYWCDIEDWRPDSSGRRTLISHHTWEDKVYNWNDGVMDFPGRYELQWFIYWLQSLPGYENNIPYIKDDSVMVMSNWWKFIYDWDKYTKDSVGLYHYAPEVSAPEAEHAEFDVYPNPADDILFVKIESIAPAGKAEIIDMLGRRLWVDNVINATSGINVKNISKGLYIIKIGKTCRTFVKQ